ncbi:hypothetical protein J6590_070933 [Homalodisca vitripennis]|nr:hypothetical protein J6590_070933 [Homalodisca vitripennis]
MIPEVEIESTDIEVAKLRRENLAIELLAEAICRSHRVGKQSGLAADGRIRHPPIIVRFISYRYRRMVYDA